MAANLETRTIPAADRRDLYVETAGVDSGKTVLVQGGSPNSRHLYGPWIADADRQGIRLISYDRPGYGGSSPAPGHSVADGAADVLAIARALGVDQMAVWGYSGGGPYALASAALLPDLVVAVATVGSLAPYGEPGFDYFAGMGGHRRSVLPVGDGADDRLDGPDGIGRARRGRRARHSLVRRACRSPRRGRSIKGASRVGSGGGAGRSPRP